MILLPTCCPLHVQAIMQAAQLKADGKAQRVIVTGCLAQRYSQDLAGNIPLHVQSWQRPKLSRVAVVIKLPCVASEQLPEADMVMGFQNYSSLPRHLRGMLGLSPELDSATYSAASRTQVCTVSRHMLDSYDSIVVPILTPYQSICWCQHTLATVSTLFRGMFQTLHCMLYCFAHSMVSSIYCQAFNPKTCALSNPCALPTTMTHNKLLSLSVSVQLKENCPNLITGR